MAITSLISFPVFHDCTPVLFDRDEKEIDNPFENAVILNGQEIVTNEQVNTIYISLSLL